MRSVISVTRRHVEFLAGDVAEGDWLLAATDDDCTGEDVD